jgi:hypothetical protein
MGVGVSAKRRIFFFLGGTVVGGLTRAKPVGALVCNRVMCVAQHYSVRKAETLIVKIANAGGAHKILVVLTVRFVMSS